MGLALSALSSFAAAAESSARSLNASLLTRELGDPRAPGNLKLALALPGLAGPELARVAAEDFRVYVHPAGMGRAEGLDERYRADGVYLWRNRSRLFLDVRSVPVQEREGRATVRVVYAPGGKPLMEGLAEGELRYGSDLVDVVLAVDISRSMLYNDPKKLRVAAARAFVEMARQGGGIGRISLVTFNHRAAKNVPLIPLEEGETLINALNRIGADGLTNLDRPLQLGIDELEGSRNPVIILLTDGKNEGSVYRNTHRVVAENGIRLFTVGLSEEADHNLLREMADLGGGIYFRAVQDSDLPDIYARLAAELGKRQLLRARSLPLREGSVTLPVDSTVRRLVAMADGGARVRATKTDAEPGDLAGMFSGSLSPVQMGRPEPGDWTFSWDRAAPDISTLSLFGDTRFFLDAFPPQLIGDTLSVGVTLAEGARPLAGGSVRVEPVPGILPDGLVLYDDGLHGDGRAGDGVYAATVKLADAPARLELVILADGEVGEGREGFVRQSAGLAIRSPQPPPEAVARIEGEVDFGILFPGETGLASAAITLEAKNDRELSLDLSWHDAGDAWPGYSSSVRTPPGRHGYELEITVPDDAPPGAYRGTFSVSDGDGADDSTEARVVVGTVRFDESSEIDLGAVPPGTFVERDIVVTYMADKVAPLECGVEGPETLSVSPGASELAAGRGAVRLEVSISAPIGMDDGEYRGRVVLAAGPGSVTVPLRWRVQPYAAETVTVPPVSGLPRAPELPASTRPLEGATAFDQDLWRADQPIHATEPLDSPWEKSEAIFREPSRQTGEDAGPASSATRFSFPSVGEDKGGGGGFWSAWWLYILAALLLLLLLLLLLAYLLYRLGKSHLARMLLASALANIILIIIFILLLGTASAMMPRRTPTVTVTLVEDAAPVDVVLSAAEQALLGGSSLEAASEAGGGALAGMGEIAMAAAETAVRSGDSLAAEKRNQLPAASGMELADAREASAAPFEQRESRALRRRERNHEREELSPSGPELPEMAEPRNDGEIPDRRDGAPEVGETRLRLVAAESSRQPVWSDGERPQRPVASEPDRALSETTGMETVRWDRPANRAEPRGRRAAARQHSAEYPEPRSEIDDPARDASEQAFREAQADRIDDPGVEEVRMASRVLADADMTGEKPGSLPLPGVARLDHRVHDRSPRGFSGDDDSPSSQPRGGLRSAAGRAARDGSALSGPEAGGLPGGTGAGARNGAVGRGESGGGAVGEKRFDLTADGSEGGGGTSGSRPASSMAAGGGDASPNPFARGGGDGNPGSESLPSGGEGGLAGMPSRGGPSARGHLGSGSPEGSSSIPGGVGVPGDERKTGTGTGQGDRSGRIGTLGREGGDGLAGRGRGSGTVEGRVDGMASGDGEGGSGARSGGGLPGLGRSDLAGDGFRSGLGVVSLSGDEGNWRRAERRVPGRAGTGAASSLQADSLLIIVGDFARVHDAAAEALFGRLPRLLARGGMTVEERLLVPGAENLADTLLAIASSAEAEGWSDAEVDRVAGYLAGGGHLWLDAAGFGTLEPVMRRLARATGGEYGPLDPSHQLADGEEVEALTLDGRLLAVATRQDWRRDWGYGGSRDRRTLRFLVRSLNYFLSGDAEAGITLEPQEALAGTLVQPYAESIPDALAGGGSARALWDDFGPGTAEAWRMPSWSDSGQVAAISDGQGGRALKMDLEPAAKGRAAVYRTLAPAQNMESAGFVALDAYYDGGGEATLSMVFTVREGDGWRDYETRPVSLRGGWNRLRFDLAGTDFRSLSGPGGTGPLPGLGQIGRAGFFVYRKSGTPAVVLFRDIRLLEE